jgi:hypothetical protein
LHYDGEEAIEREESEKREEAEGTHNAADRDKKSWQVSFSASTGKLKSSK